jgi:hypothetical protein
MLTAMAVVSGLSCRAPAFPSSAQAAPVPQVHLFPKGIPLKPEDVDAADKYEAALSDHYEIPAPKGSGWFVVLQGKSRVLVVAGHATAQTRDHQIKPADGGTGSLAMMLNRYADTPVIQTTYESPSDPNYYDDNDFKATLKTLVSTLHPLMVIDLHASHPSRPYDVDFGTMDGASLLGHPDLLERLAFRLRSEGLENLSQDFFGASKNQTVTKWVSGLGVPTIQCEINASWLLPAPAAGKPADPWTTSLQHHRFSELLEGLVRYVSEIDERSVPTQHQ